MLRQFLFLLKQLTHYANILQCSSKQAAWINIEYQNINYENHDIEK